MQAQVLMEVASYGAGLQVEGRPIAVCYLFEAWPKTIGVGTIFLSLGLLLSPD